MNAVPSPLQREAAELSATVVQPIPGSRKVHVQGSRADLRVPMREISQADTPSLFGAHANAPFTVYDTSGPYTDPAHTVDLAAGLPPLRAGWIGERGDTRQLADFSSPFTRRHASAASLADVRFPAIPRPRVATGGANVTQMHYARRGIVTPEMEFVALRENQRLEILAPELRRQHRGQSFGAAIPARITP
jgi:phosphomethylpyrimidine synthase